MPNANVYSRYKKIHPAALDIAGRVTRGGLVALVGLQAPREFLGLPGVLMAHDVLYFTLL
jgi:hypothetical protein